MNWTMQSRTPGNSLLVSLVLPLRPVIPPSTATASVPLTTA
jgi:hypothetical protein